MAYTAEGCITSRGENEDHRIIEVAFHNLHARKRVPHLSDFFDFTLAALGDRVRCHVFRHTTSLKLTSYATSEKGQHHGIWHGVELEAGLKCWGWSLESLQSLYESPYEISCTFSGCGETYNVVGADYIMQLIELETLEQSACTGALQGVLYGSAASPGSPASVLWRPFDDPQTQQWSLSLPEGEDVAAVAAGRQFCAAATSTRMLRIFAESGGTYETVK
jgi:Minichromosome loss protein, Mcl1, middle region